MTSWAPPDPRMSQTRLAVTPAGRQVWVELTGDDRLAAVKKLPSRWPEVIMARERGESLDSIATWAKCPPPCRPSCRFREDPDPADPTGELKIQTHVGPECLSFMVAECYTILETHLHDLAAMKAKWM